MILKLQIFCAHISWTSIVLRVFSSANYIWYILSHVSVVTIAANLLWHISRPWARGIYWHTLKVHNLGEGGRVLNLANLANLRHQKLMPREFQGFHDELNIFIWNFAGTYWTFPRWSTKSKKKKKKCRGILDWDKFYPFLFVSMFVFYVTLFLENHSIFLKKFCTVVLGIILVARNPPVC